MGAWATILDAVTSPLALAALTMLILSSVFASVLKLRRVSDRALAAKIARYMFFISLVALIGGLATYTIIELVGGDVRVSGTIQIGRASCRETL